MTIYRERLWASAWVFISTALVIPASLLVFLPINELAGVVCAIVLYAGCVIFLVIASPTVEVTTELFLAGRARLPIEYAGETSGYRKEDATLERGQYLDSRAWLLLRGWVTSVVKVEVTDESDQTPYWLVSTRQPEKVVAAISEAKRLKAASAAS